jgi:hypothetical protein
LESITLPSSITEICDYTFYNCKYLREIVLNDGLQKIGRSAFSNCKSLESISVPSTVLQIGECAFARCESLREVMLHGEITEIVYRAFRKCESLEAFRFPTLSSRLGGIACHWGELNNKVEKVRGVVQWEDGKLFVPPAAMEERRNRDSINSILYKIEMLISLYKMLLKCPIDVPGPVKDVILEYVYPQSNQE